MRSCPQAVTAIGTAIRRQRMPTRMRLMCTTSTPIEHLSGEPLRRKIATRPPFATLHMRPTPTTLPPSLPAFAAVQSALLLAGLAALGVQASSAPPMHSALGVATLLVAAWALWAALRERISPLQALMVQAGALATATSAMGLLHWHWLFKPLTMVIAIIFVASTARWTS